MTLNLKSKGTILPLVNSVIMLATILSAMIHLTPPANFGIFQLTRISRESLGRRNISPLTTQRNREQPVNRHNQLQMRVRKPHVTIQPLDLIRLKISAKRPQTCHQQCLRGSVVGSQCNGVSGFEKIPSSISAGNSFACNKICFCSSILKLWHQSVMSVPCTLRAKYSLDCTYTSHSEHAHSQVVCSHAHTCHTILRIHNSASESQCCLYSADRSQAAQAPVRVSMHRSAGNKF